MGKKELLFSVTKNDLVIEFFSGHGPGGQNRNKCQNCCRIKHPESGAVATGQEQRSREQNMRNAFRRLSETVKFKLWVHKKVWEIDHKKTTEQFIDEQMHPSNLKIEVLENDKWTAWNDQKQ